MQITINLTTEVCAREGEGSGKEKPEGRQSKLGSLGKVLEMIFKVKSKDKVRGAKRM